MGGGAFKAGGRTPRQIVTEETYAKGMQFTNSPLFEGFCKALVNFDFRDMGAMLVPRPGFRTLHSVLAGAVDEPHDLHHYGQALVRNAATDEDTTANYIFLSPVVSDTLLFDFTDSLTLVEEEFSPDFSGPHNFSSIPHTVTQTGVGEPAVLTDDEYLIRVKERPEIQMLHNISLGDPDTFKAARHVPIKAMLNGATYVPVQHTPAGGAAANGFAKMLLKTATGETKYNEMSFVTPKEVTPTEAINYGYNMLKALPYTFSDKLTNAGIIYMEGILPYADAACAQLKFNAKVGEPITFRLYAQYPDSTTEFVFRWELREIGTDNVTIYEDETITNNYYKFATTKAVNYGVTPNTDFVKLTIQPPYKQFSVTVTAYDKLDLTTALQVMTLASYSMGADAQSSVTNIEPRAYPLHTASDMCTWRQRVVLWGVQSAPNTIFVSDINDPSYFPYPNNCEIFEEAVVSCVPYLGSLLVFTESKIFKMTVNETGLGFTTTMVQDKLSLTAFDRETVTLVQNLVYFKNGNYFYMIVPRTSANAPIGSLQLAPISTPITYLLDHFEQEVRNLVFTIYNPDDPTYFPRKLAGTHYDIRLQDYHNYLDGTLIRNIYKYELVLIDTSTGVVTDVVLRFDFMLNYDTMSRAWSTYITQTNSARIAPYRQSVTDATIFASARSLYNEDEDYYEVYVDFIKPDNANRVDDFPLEETAQVKERIFKNHQLLDTGNRDHNSSYKKRYREVQFRVNATDEQSLQFGTEFLVDDQVRKGLFEYVVSHITNPDDPDYGWVYIEKVFADPLNAAGATILEDEEDPSAPYLPTSQVVLSDTVMLQSNRWVLGVSQLAHTISNKLRLKVSGKGYMPRLILLSFNDRYYELLNHSWVYRTMSAR